MQRAIVLAGVVPMLAASPALGQCDVQELVPAHGNFAWLGGGVAIDGDTLVVSGTPEHESSLLLVFERAGAAWAETTRIRPGNLPAQNEFPAHVAIAGRTIAASDPLNDVVYVFERTGTGWHEAARLAPSQCSPSWFGKSLALCDDVLVVGDASANCITVFQRVLGSWRESGSFAGAGYFGHDVATDGQSILVGNFAGAPVRTFDRTASGWAPGPTIHPPESLEFGVSVAVDGPLALVGDPGELDTYFPGRAHVYRRRGDIWVHEQELRVTPSPTGDWLGWNLTIQGGRAAISADHFGPLRSRIHVYDLTHERWKPSAVLSDGNATLVIGLSMSEGRIAMTTALGKAYVFDRIDCGRAVDYCEATFQSGRVPRISFAGSLRISDDSFTLKSYDAAPGATGLFFYSPHPTQRPFGNGVLCVGAPSSATFRFAPLVVPGTAIASQKVDFTQPPAGSGPGQIVPGSTRYFQFAFHDAGILALTEGMRVTFCP